MILLAATLTYAGFTALCLGMDRHHRQVLNRTPPRSAPLRYRLLASVLLAAALAAAVAGWGASVGIVAWFGLLTAVALTVTLLLTFAPRFVAAAGLAAPLLGGAAAIFGAVA